MISKISIVDKIIVILLIAMGILCTAIFYSRPYINTKHHYNCECKCDSLEKLKPNENR